MTACALLKAWCDDCGAMLVGVLQQSRRQLPQGKGMLSCGAEVGEGVTFLLRYARCRVCKRLACENCASNNPCFAGSLLSFVLGGRESKVFQNSPLKDSMGVRWLEEEFGHLKLDKLLFSYHGIMA